MAKTKKTRKPRKSKHDEPIGQNQARDLTG